LRSYQIAAFDYKSGDGQFVVLDTLLINLDQVFERYIRNRHALHFHRIECSSWDCSIWFNAFIAMSRIVSRLDFNALSVVSINSVPSADVSHSVCALTHAQTRRSSDE